MYANHTAVQYIYCVPAGTHGELPNMHTCDNRHGLISLHSCLLTLVSCRFGAHIRFFVTHPCTGDAIAQEAQTAMVRIGLVCLHEALGQLRTGLDPPSGPQVAVTRLFLHVFVGRSSAE